MRQASAQTRWQDRLAVLYPEQQDHPDGYCIVCAESSALCQSAVIEVVDDLALRCKADAEDVAKWLFEQKVSLSEVSVYSLAELYREHLEGITHV